MINPVYRWQDAPRADFAVIGDPIAHTLSPKMHAAAYSELGMELRYIAVRVPPGQAAAALDRLAELGFQGVNVTVPHKEAAFAWLRQPDPVAARVRACNTLSCVERAGTNTDAPGFLETLRQFSLPRKARVLLLGAGGSGRAVAAAIDGCGHDLSIHNRTPANAQRLVDELGLAAKVVESIAVEEFDLVVNSTPLSLEGQTLAIDWTRAKPSAVAYDLAYGAHPTPFVEGAREAGLVATDGRALLLAQGALAFEWWLGRSAPREAMAEALL